MQAMLIAVLLFLPLMQPAESDVYAPADYEKVSKLEPMAIRRRGLLISIGCGVVIGNTWQQTNGWNPET